jgi:predicted amidohydrolase YtcJ
LINLKGHTVIPGLIDTHNHVVVTSLRPGHDVRLDLPASIGEMQQGIRDKVAKIPSGQWVTSVGGWSPEQFSEKRMPTQVELDIAAPNNPVYIQTGFDGPAATNSKGRAFFEGRGLKVGPTGNIDINAPTVAAYNALLSLQTPADRKRGALDVMEYAASVGLTMSDDKGGTWPLDTPAKGIAEIGNRTNVLDPFHGYDQFLALDHEGKMSMRLRIFFYMQDLTPDLPFLTARLDNQFRNFGDDWLKVSGIGERVYAGAFPLVPKSPSTIYEAATRLVAQRGWAHDEHAMGLADEKEVTRVWEQINQETPLAPLRWSLAHVPGIDEETLKRLAAMGVGVSAAGSRYTATTPPRTSPSEISPFRRLVHSGIRLGYGSDGGTVAPLNPWPHLYYMVTGKNSAGELVADGQSLTRMEALRLYTSSQPWFTGEEDKLGSIEVGKLADIVVLSEDFFDVEKVPDEAIKRIHSLLTIVGGKVVYRSETAPAARSGLSH